MRHLNGYPRWFYSFLLWSLSFLFLSGVLLLPYFFYLRLEWDLPIELELSWHSGFAGLHLFLSLLITMAVGALGAIHIRIGWRKKQKLGSGFSLLICFALLVLSAIAIYYVGDERWSVSASVIHVGVAALIAGLFIWHLLSRKTPAWH